MSTLTAKQKAFLALARSHPEGIADDAVEKALPEMGLEERMKVINELAAKSLITFMRQGNSLLYKAKTDAEAGKMAMMDDHERIIYQHIEDADNEGIWLKRLRDRTGLPAKVVDRCIKKMEQKLLIKSVASVKFPTRKIYMLFDLTPSVELTGGPWYTDQELDVDFIDTLATQCYKFILSR
ncbi:34-kDa subunit of RNA polymerase III (C), partial [Dimargaris xerosporica]